MGGRLSHPLPEVFHTKQAKQIQSKKEIVSKKKEEQHNQGHRTFTSVTVSSLKIILKKCMAHLFDEFGSSSI